MPHFLRTSPTPSTPLSSFCVSRISRGAGMDRAQDLRLDYDRLGDLLAQADGSAAAAIARERRIIGALLEALETPVEVPLVDQLADRRRSRTKAPRAAARGGESG